MGVKWTLEDLEKKGLAKAEDGSFSRLKGILNKNTGIPNKTKSASANKKVKNATPCIHEGIKYRSKLERYMAVLLMQNGFDFTYEAKFVLQPSFIYFGKKIQAITHNPDFFLEKLNAVVECKGLLTEAATLRIKIFKKHLVDNKLPYQYFMPRNQKQCREVIENLLTL